MADYWLLSKAGCINILVMRYHDTQVHTINRGEGLRSQFDPCLCPLSVIKSNTIYSGQIQSTWSCNIRWPSTHTQINHCQSSGRSLLLLPFPSISSGRGHHWDDREVLFTAFCWSRLPLIKTCRSSPFHGPQKICKTFDGNKACTRLMMMFWSMRTQ